jgi:flavin-dependent dehydrogenase
MQGDAKFDVIIIGAGPAGIAAALPLLEVGRRVLILERGPLDAAKLPETLVAAESLSPGLAAIVSRVALEAKLPFDVCFISPGGENRLRMEYFGSGKDLKLKRIDRSRFDTLLRQEVLDQGGVILFRENATAVELRQDADQTVMVRHSGQGGERESRAELVIDASGKSYLLKTSLGLTDSGRVLDKRGGWFTHFIVSGRSNLLPAAVNIIPLDAGFLYAIWINPTRLSLGVTLFNPKDEAGELLYRHALAQVDWIQEVIGNAQQVLPVIPVQNRAFRLEQLASAQYLVAGDAGGFMDPFFCNGIQIALETGQSAGKVANEILGSSVERRRELAAAYARSYAATVTRCEEKMTGALAGFGWPIRQRHLTDPHIPYPISAVLAGLSVNAPGDPVAHMRQLREAV